VESPVARGRAGSAVTCSRQCIRNFGAWCASGDGLRRAAAGGQPARRRRCGRAGLTRDSPPSSAREVRPPRRLQARQSRAADAAAAPADDAAARLGSEQGGASRG